MEVTPVDDRSSEVIPKSSEPIIETSELKMQLNGITKDEENSNRLPSDMHLEVEKKWKISSIVETEKNCEKTAPIITEIIENGHRDDGVNQSSEVILTSDENKKWEIESIHTIADVDDDDDKMTTQMKALPYIAVNNVDDTDINDGKCEMHPASADNDFISTEIIDGNWDLRSVYSLDDRASLKSESVFMEESWTEQHSIPIHSSLVQLKTPELPRKPLVYTITPVNQSSVLPRPKFVGNSSIRYPIHTSNCEISIGNVKEPLRHQKEKSKPVDHYSYQYSEPLKAEKLMQLTNSNNGHHSTVLKTLNKSLKKSPSLDKGLHKTHGRITDCIRQTIHVDNDDEEILGLPLLFDENGNPIKILKDTKSFNSITENVSFQIQNMNAQMTIQIGVEMFHNSDPRRQMWKRKQVKVTRIVEIDLSKVRDKHRLRDIIDRCKANDSSKSKPGISATTVDKLSGPNAYSVFDNLMAITREEERESDTEENLYVTTSPSGSLTSVICEPQFLLCRLKERKKASFLY